MKFIQKVGVRIVNYGLAIAEYCLGWREPRLLTGYTEMIDALTYRDIDNVLIVADQNIYKFGLTKFIEEKLKTAGIKYSMFLDVTPNPTFKNVADGKEVYVKNNCKGLIAIGGGSVMDCAKSIGVLITNPEPLEKYKGLFKVHHNIPTMIAIPTTSGTGSETTVAAVIRNENTGAKFPIESMRLVPKFALLDKHLLKDLPPFVFATTGMDALTHAIEAYLNYDTTSKTRRYSLDAMKLIKENLENGYKDKKDLEAKERMLHASFLAGKAFTRSMVGNVHAIAHALGGKYNLPHGYLNAIILPHILEMYKNKSKKKLSHVAKYIGLGKEELTDIENAQIFIDWIRNLNKEFGLPERIKEIQEMDIPELAEKSYKEAVPLYPCPLLFNKKDFEKIYKSIKE